MMRCLVIDNSPHRSALPSRVFFMHFEVGRRHQAIAVVAPRPGARYTALMGPKLKATTPEDRGRQMLEELPPDEAALVSGDEAGELVDGAAYVRWLETGEGECPGPGSSG